MADALTELEMAAYRTMRWLEAAASDGTPPNALPAALEDGVALAGADLQVPRASAQDVINLDQAADLLGVRSRERATQLVREHRLASWPNPGGRHETLVCRGKVIALREQRSGGNGTGSGEEQPGDRGRAPGGGAARADSAA